MNEPAPPPWESDSLSTFLFNAARNERVSSLKFPDIFALLQRLHAAFQSVAEITANDHSALLLPTRFLMARAHAAFLAALRLAMSGQVVEVYMALRGVIEAAWYALHLAKDPQPPSRVMLWLHRSEDPTARARCRTEFTVANVRATHAALDPATAAAFQTLYDWTIDLGAHPNEQGVFTAMTRDDAAEPRMFNVVVLSDNAALVVTALKIATDIAVGGLKTFRLIFPERFAITGLEIEVEAIIRSKHELFQRYAALLQA